MAPKHSLTELHLPRIYGDWVRFCCVIFLCARLPLEVVGVGHLSFAFRMKLFLDSAGMALVGGNLGGWTYCTVLDLSGEG